MLRIPKKARRDILAAQRNEITEYYVYRNLAKTMPSQHNKKILEGIADCELGHYNFWRTISKEEVAPNRFRIAKYVLISKLLGLTFGLKLMERGEQVAQANYENLAKYIPLAAKIEKEEDMHEQELIGILNEERLEYVGSIVLGLNDALVELTGALAGFTLALQNGTLIAMAGLVTGISASLSIAASEYLSTKSEKSSKQPGKAALYTGIAYIATVIILILPFLLLSNLYVALAYTMSFAILIILFFTYYTSVAKDLSFRNRFLEMAAISLGVAALSFGVGYVVRILFDI